MSFLTQTTKNLESNQELNKSCACTYSENPQKNSGSLINTNMNILPTQVINQNLVSKNDQNYIVPKYIPINYIKSAVDRIL